MRIGELAAATGVSVRAVRYYEEQGLLTASRSQRGHRLYEADAVARVQLIQQLYAAGFASRTIVELLPYVDAQVTTSHSRAVLLAQREKINEQITALVGTRAALDRIIAAAETCAMRDAQPGEASAAKVLEPVGS